MPQFETVWITNQTGIFKTDTYLLFEKKKDMKNKENWLQGASKEEIEEKLQRFLIFI